MNGYRPLNKTGDRPKGVLVIGSDGMLGSALSRAMHDARLAGRALPTPRSAPEWAALLVELRNRPPERVVWSDPVRLGLAGHERGAGTRARGARRTFLALLCTCTRAEVARLINILPHCIYSGDVPVPLREDDLWRGHPEGTLAHYGAARRKSVTMAAACRRRHGLRTTHLIVSGLYGPGDRYDTGDGQVVGAMVRRFVEARRAGRETVCCWGTGSCRRELLHVDDAARAILALAGNEEPLPADEDTVLNVGGPHVGAIELSIRDLATEVAAAAGYRGRIAWDPTRPEGRRRVALHEGRLRDLIPARAGVPLPLGLRSAVAECREQLAAVEGSHDASPRGWSKSDDTVTAG